jgi:transposase
MAKATMRRRVNRYSNEFKITAVKMTTLPGTLVQDVAKILDIHPFMLSRWKKEYREGKIHGVPHPDLKKIKDMEEAVTEKSRILELETALKKAQMENDLLKKVIRFNAEQKHMPSPLLTGIIKTMALPSSAATSVYPEAATTPGRKDR